MSWAKLDDNFGDHPKVADLSDAAFRLHVRAICYAAKYRTLGELTPAAVKVLGAKAKHIAELHAANLWESTSRPSWVIHDFLVYNPSREITDEIRAERAAAGRLGGQKSGEIRRSKPEANLLPESKQNGSKTEANSHAGAAARAFPSRPVPASKEAVGADAPASKKVTDDYLKELQPKHPTVNVREVYADASNRKVWDGYKDQRRALAKYIGWAEEKVGGKNGQPVVVGQNVNAIHERHLELERIAWERKNPGVPFER